MMEHANVTSGGVEKAVRIIHVQTIVQVMVLVMPRQGNASVQRALAGKRAKLRNARITALVMVLVMRSLAHVCVSKASLGKIAQSKNVPMEVSVAAKATVTTRLESVSACLAGRVRYAQKECAQHLPHPSVALAMDFATVRMDSVHA
jgi:hypothetical protein